MRPRLNEINDLAQVGDIVLTWGQKCPFYKGF
jgi:hypothetical protein